MSKVKIAYSLCLILLLVAFTTFSSFGQEKSETARLSGTNENHQVLASLAGSWTFAGKHTFAGSTHIIEFKGTMTRTPLWDGRYFTSEVTGQEIPMPWSNGKPVTLHEMMTEGYDNVKGKFVSSYINNEFETGIILLEGDYNTASKTITYEGETLSPPRINLPAGSMRKFHVLLKFIDNDHYTLEWHESICGKQLFDTVLNFTRK
ncbi:DUF1579 family protein [Mucilaginibacter sp. UYCu711]|uniref:DUF1579 family protein n=1 Tax=Mucilaginibacter sp. UYCu711 TaxID=3156339 RepID=UPI003D257436